MVIAQFIDLRGKFKVANEYAKVTELARAACRVRLSDRDELAYKT